MSTFPIQFLPYQENFYNTSTPGLMNSTLHEVLQKTTSAKGQAQVLALAFDVTCGYVNVNINQTRPFSSSDDSELEINFTLDSTEFVSFTSGSKLPLGNSAATTFERRSGYIHNKHCARFRWQPRISVLLENAERTNLCGKTVEITNTNNGKKQDLSVGAFKKIATEAEGVVPRVEECRAPVLALLN
ncbi:hypothetical protein GGX14DRAFT_676352 [Mycena pura]|uniref:Uncharacterized protein n=1 Tax=Mycena pura TaxID=153505 RepID=A0AAD6VS03_9AGAR|nr:hypothetical protein GGX14DRAFT_676352 [Mycena pura]